MRFFPKSQSGFTFVEAIITFSIMGIFLALTWATVQFLVGKSTDQIVKTRAHFLAIEGVELTKQIRQTHVNRNRRNGFTRSIGNKEGDYYLSKVGDEYDLAKGDPEKIIIEDDPYMMYCRSIGISGDTSNDDERMAEVKVSWGDLSDCKKNTTEVAYQIYMGDIAKK